MPDGHSTALQGWLSSGMYACTARVSKSSEVDPARGRLPAYQKFVHTGSIRESDIGSERVSH